MSKLALMDQHLPTINGSLERAEERFATPGCATNGRTRHISVHAPRTTLIDTDWDTIGDTEESPIDSSPIPSTVRQIANPTSSTTPAGIVRVGSAVAAPNGGCGSVAESLRQQDRRRSAPGRPLFFIAGLVAGIGITLGLSMVINGGYRLPNDSAKGNAVRVGHTALPQTLESERANITNPVPGQPATGATRVPASRPESMGTQPSKSRATSDDSLKDGASGEPVVPPATPSSLPSASASKLVRATAPQWTRRVTRVRRPKQMANDNPY